MAEFPAFPLWTDAYLADTHHLTTIEHGAYLLLLMAMWRNDGVLPNDDRELARYAHMTPLQWQRIRPTLLKFFRNGGAVITQGRLTDELAYVKEHSKKQAAKARARWAVEQTPPLPVKQTPLGVFDESDAKSLELLNTSDAAAMPERCRSDAPTPTPTPSKIEPNGSFPETRVSGITPTSLSKKRQSYPEAFEAAWKAYPTTVNMSKAEGFKEWAKLDAEDQQKVVKAIPGFIAYCKATPDYRPVYFERFIRQRRFDGYVMAATSSAPSEADWRRRLIYARDRRTWSVDEWGPMPGNDGCQVPPALLMAGDGNGWANQQRAA